MDGYGHTAGAVDGFRPNMSADDMAELDRRRGLGDQGSFSDPEIIVRKRPWLKPDGTHKSQSEATMNDGMMDLVRSMHIPEGGKPFGKPLPEKREGESEFERQIRHFTEKVKDDPKKYPGGQKQAIAIAAHEAGVTKKGGTATEQSRRASERAAGRRERQINIHHTTLTHKGPPPIPGSSSGGGVGGGGAMGVISSAPKPPGLGAGPKVPKMSAGPSNYHRPAGLSPQIKGVSVEADDKDKENGELADKLFGKNVMPAPAAGPSMSPPSPPAPMPAGGAMATSTMKALSSRSFYIPPPLQEYDPFNVHRNAMTIPVSKSDVQETSAPVRLGEVYKSCAAHGITYRADQGCHPCSVHKSSTCMKCGSSMMKTAGGGLSCPRGH